MRCIKCRSPRITRFLDGFGEFRIFCKSCQESITLMEFYEAKFVKKVSRYNMKNNLHKNKKKMASVLRFIKHRGGVLDS